jgi:small subunit ribosomal protein S21
LAVVGQSVSSLARQSVRVVVTAPALKAGEGMFSLCFTGKRISGVKRLVKVKKRPNESPEQLLRRFRKSVAKSRIMSDYRRKRWHVSKSELRRIKKKKAIRRMKRRQSRRRSFNR